MNKIVASADAAVADISDGAVIMAGGFGLCGIPENLLDALVRRGVRGLTVISNNAGIKDEGVGRLLASGQIGKLIGTYVGENPDFERMYNAGTIECELVPQGSFAERIRAAGAGIPAFFTPAGVGTVVAEGKEQREFDGRTYLMERALKADFALVKAYRGDRWGNLTYRRTARNFNPEMATAGRVTIVEVEEIVALGELDPDEIVTPSLYVQRVVLGSHYRKTIERATSRKPA